MDWEDSISIVLLAATSLLMMLPSHRYQEFIGIEDSHRNGSVII